MGLLIFEIISLTLPKTSQPEDQWCIFQKKGIFNTTPISVHLQHHRMYQCLCCKMHLTLIIKHLSSSRRFYSSFSLFCPYETNTCLWKPQLVPHMLLFRNTQQFSLGVCNDKCRPSPIVFLYHEKMYFQELKLKLLRKTRICYFHNILE